jgi:hypothetical protein
MNDDLDGEPLDQTFFLGQIFLGIKRRITDPPPASRGGFAPISPFAQQRIAERDEQLARQRAEAVAATNRLAALGAGFRTGLLDTATSPGAAVAIAGATFNVPPDAPADTLFALGAGIDLGARSTRPPQISLPRLPFGGGREIGPVDPGPPAVRPVEDVPGAAAAIVNGIQQIDRLFARNPADP